MTGHFLGKELSSLDTILKIFDIEDKELVRLILLLIRIIDEEISKIVSAKIKAESEAAEAKSKAAGKRGR